MQYDYSFSGYKPAKRPNKNKAKQYVHLKKIFYHKDGDILVKQIQKTHGPSSFPPGPCVFFLFLQ